MNLRELKLKNRKTCDCGYEFSNNDIVPPIVVNKDYKFYGGRVEYYTKAKCKTCGQEVYLLLEAYDNKYRVIDIGIEEGVALPELAPVEEPKEEKVEEVPEIKEEPEEVKTEGFVCDKCGREFKSKSGLASHQRKCK